MALYFRGAICGCGFTYGRKVGTYEYGCLKNSKSLFGGIFYTASIILLCDFYTVYTKTMDIEKTLPVDIKSWWCCACSLYVSIISTSLLLIMNVSSESLSTTKLWPREGKRKSAIYFSRLDNL